MGIEDSEQTGEGSVVKTTAAEPTAAKVESGDQGARGARGARGSAAQRPSMLRRAARFAGRSANWFLPISTARHSVHETKASLGRIGRAFGLLRDTLRSAWRQARTKHSPEDVEAAEAQLRDIADPERLQIMRSARGMWALGVGMFLVGVTMVAFGAISAGSKVAVVVYFLAAILWSGFGIGYAMRSAADYHALRTRAPVSGMTVLRDVSLWLPLGRANAGGGQPPAATKSKSERTRSKRRR